MNAYYLNDTAEDAWEICLQGKVTEVMFKTSGDDNRRHAVDRVKELNRKRLKAWRVNVLQYTSIVPADTRARAIWQAFQGAREANVVEASDWKRFHAVRAPEHDGWALRARLGCYEEQFLPKPHALTVSVLVSGNTVSGEQQHSEVGVTGFEPATSWSRTITDLPTQESEVTPDTSVRPVSTEVARAESKLESHSGGTRAAPNTTGNGIADTTGASLPSPAPLPPLTGGDL